MPTIAQRFIGLAACCSFVLEVCGCSASPSLDDVPKPVHEKANQELSRTKGIWWGKAHVVVGQVRLEEPSDELQIVSRTQILDDGYFAAFLAPSRTLSFRAHGYEPLDITPPSDAGKLVRVGENVMEKTPRDQLASLKGRVVGPDAVSSGKAKVLLKVDWAPPIWLDEGRECASVAQSVVESRQISFGEEFIFNGLSPIPYEIEITSEGYNSVSRTVTPQRGETMVVEDIQMSGSPQVRLTWIAQFDAPTEIQGKNTTSKTIVCDGDSTFLFTDERDELGNKLHLYLLPTDKGVESYFWYTGSSFHDLGATSLDETRNVLAKDGLPSEDSSAGRKIILQDGHVYLFRCPEKKASCLFLVEFL